MLNQARLKVLQAQQQHIQNLLAEARTRLSKASADRNNYSRVIRDLIIQALFQVKKKNKYLKLYEMCDQQFPLTLTDYGAYSAHSLPRSRLGFGGGCATGCHRAVQRCHEQALSDLDRQGQLSFS